MTNVGRSSRAAVISYGMCEYTPGNDRILVLNLIVARALSNAPRCKCTNECTPGRGPTFANILDAAGRLATLAVSLDIVGRILASDRTNVKIQLVTRRSRDERALRRI